VKVKLPLLPQLAERAYVSSIQVGVLIIGAGPTGLGAATRLNQHGVKDWLLIDQVGTSRRVTCCAAYRLPWSMHDARSAWLVLCRL